MRYCRKSTILLNSLILQTPLSDPLVLVASFSKASAPDLHSPLSGSFLTLETNLLNEIEDDPLLHNMIPA